VALWSPRASIRRAGRAAERLVGSPGQSPQMTISEKSGYELYTCRNCLRARPRNQESRQRAELAKGKAIQYIDVLRRLAR
jgi:hypothetical protein